MNTQEKWRLGGNFLVLAGCVAMFGSMFPMGYLAYRIFFAMLLGGMVTASAGYFIRVAVDEKDSFVMRRWWVKLNMGSKEEFPRTAQERAALRIWASSTLEIRAACATNAFKSRDGAKSELDALTRKELAQAFTPQTLVQLRKDRLKEIEQQARALRDEEQLAKFIQKGYAERWDFFKAMGMLPVNPDTGELWADPNAFRLSLMLNKNEEVPQAAGVPAAA